MDSVLPYRANDEGGPSTSQDGDGSGDSSRRWDEPPPEGQPRGAPGNETSLLIVHGRKMRNKTQSLSQVKRISFSPRDTHFAALVRQGNSCFVATWEASSLRPVTFPTPINAADFAFAFPPDSALMALSFKGAPGAKLAVFSVFDFSKRDRRVRRLDVPMALPVAYSPDGSLVASADPHEPGHVALLSGPKFERTRTIMGHTEPVTHLAFTADGEALASLSQDGTARLTSVRTGRTLHRYETDCRYRPAMLQVSPDGATVASVWGRMVNLWHPAGGAVNSYDLNAVRQAEGWPLCISANCRYLACRTEEGFDVSDLATGKVKGTIPAPSGGMVMSAGFSSDSRILVVGTSDGEVHFYNIVTAD